MGDPYLAVLDELRDLTMKKRAGYAPGADPFANFRMTEMFSVPCQCGCGVATPIPPIFGIMIREMDKMARIASLLAKPSNEQVGESLRETMMDAGNYPLIGVAFTDSEQQPGPITLDEYQKRKIAEMERDFIVMSEGTPPDVFDSSEMEPPEDADERCCVDNCGCCRPCPDCRNECPCS